MITYSRYLTQMGSHKSFREKMEALIEDYTTHQQQMVFITDGAPWLKNWIEDAFPQAPSILDFYHLLEHVYQCSEAFFVDAQQGSRWVEQQKELLLESHAAQVIDNVHRPSCFQKKTTAKSQLLAYLEANRSPMDYKYYQRMNCGIIGSEPLSRLIVQQ